MNSVVLVVLASVCFTGLSVYGPGFLAAGRAVSAPAFLYLSKPCLVSVRVEIHLSTLFYASTPLSNL